MGRGGRSAVNEPTGTINPGGARLLLRSSNAGDTMALTLWGRRNTVNGLKWDSQSYTLTGTTPVLTEAPITVTDGDESVTINRRWYEFFQAIAASNNAGDITISQQGSPSAGSITVLSDPTEGSTLTMGPTGLTTVYTFRSPYRGTILCPAGSALNASGNASYVRIQLGANDHYFWFAIGTAIDPTPGGTGHEIAATALDANTVIASALWTSISTFFPSSALIASLSSDTVGLTGYQLGNLSVTLSQDAADFTLTTVAAGTAQAANQIRRDFNLVGEDVSASDIADFIEQAVNANSDWSGILFGSATTENTYIEADQNDEVVTLTGRDNYSLGTWVLSQSGAAFTLQGCGGR